MINRLLWAGTCALLAVNLGLLVWLWLSPPAATPFAPALAGKSKAAHATAQPEPLPTALPKTDRLAILMEGARKSLRTEPDAKALAMMRNNLEGRFAVLFRALELDEAGLAQLEQLLLTRHQMEKMARDVMLAAGVIPTLEQLQSATKYATGPIDAQIAATLGPAKAPIFASFLVRSIDHRAVDSLSAKLSYTEQSLTSDAQRALRTAIMESTDQAGFLERAAGILEPGQMDQLLKTYEARESMELRLQLLQAAARSAPPK